MKITSIAFLFLLCAPASAQSVKARPKIEKIAAQISKFDRLDDGAVGFAGEETDNYRTFLKLRDQTTPEELLAFTFDTSAVLKGYASWALVEKGYPGIGGVFSRFLQSGETVFTLFGCVGGDESLALILYTRVFYVDSVLARRQFALLDSIIFAEKNAEGLLTGYALDHNAELKKELRDLAHSRGLSLKK